jgi:hypothetical protein
VTEGDLLGSVLNVFEVRQYFVYIFGFAERFGKEFLKWYEDAG